MEWESVSCADVVPEVCAKKYCRQKRDAKDARQQGFLALGARDGCPHTDACKIDGNRDRGLPIEFCCPIMLWKKSEQSAKLQVEIFV